MVVCDARAGVPVLGGGCCGGLTELVVVRNASLHRLRSPHGQCAACGLSRPAGTCTGLGHTAPCRSLRCSTCSREGITCGSEWVQGAQPGAQRYGRPRQGPACPLYPSLHLDSYRCVTLMGLGAEESRRPPVPLKSPPSSSSWFSEAPGQCRLVRLRSWGVSPKPMWCTLPSISMATERMERLRE